VSALGARAELARRHGPRARNSGCARVAGTRRERARAQTRLCARVSRAKASTGASRVGGWRGREGVRADRRFSSLGRRCKPPPLLSTRLWLEFARRPAPEAGAARANYNNNILCSNSLSSAVGDEAGEGFELELELIQTHMAQKPMLRVEVCARCVARESKRKRGWSEWRTCQSMGWVASHEHILLPCSTPQTHTRVSSAYRIYAADDWVNRPN
jgi:hypothetical protein